MNTRTEERSARIHEQLLENESLTADLDDDAAAMLLDWMLTYTEAIAASADQIQDNEEAEEFMYPRLKGIRRFMKQVNKWIARGREWPDEKQLRTMTKLLQYASAMTGGHCTPPSQASQDAFLTNLPALLDHPSEFIAQLRTLLTAPS